MSLTLNLTRDRSKSENMWMAKFKTMKKNDHPSVPSIRVAVSKVAIFSVDSRVQWQVGASYRALLMRTTRPRH